MGFLIVLISMALVFAVANIFFMFGYSYYIGSSYEITGNTGRKNSVIKKFKNGYRLFKSL